MPPSEIKALLNRRPFVPFRIHVAEVSHYDIHNPEMVMVGTAALFIGLRREIESPYWDEPAIVALRHITRIEPLIESLTPN